MTKKDYVLIAKAIREAEPNDDQQEEETSFDGWLWTAKQIAEALQKENPKFDRNKFLLACGLEV